MHLDVFSAAAAMKLNIILLTNSHVATHTVQHTKYKLLWYAIQYKLWTIAKYVAPIGRLINLSCLLCVFILFYARILQ